jgi:hypothetical protein
VLCCALSAATTFHVLLVVIPWGRADPVFRQMAQISRDARSGLILASPLASLQRRARTCSCRHPAVCVGVYLSVGEFRERVESLSSANSTIQGRRDRCAGSAECLSLGGMFVEGADGASGMPKVWKRDVVQWHATALAAHFIRLSKPARPFSQDGTLAASRCWDCWNAPRLTRNSQAPIRLEKVTVFVVPLHRDAGGKKNPRLGGPLFVPAARSGPQFPAPWEGCC